MDLSFRRPVLNGRMSFPVCLAPMVGLSHVVARTVVRSYLPAGVSTIWPTEMLNSRKLPHENLKTLNETLLAEGESELVPQILGNEEIPICESIAKLEDWGAEGIDINMGCPVSKALRHNYGVALMGDADYAAKVVGMAKRSARVPVSVKLRAGIQGDRKYLRHFVSGLFEAGADWITLHPRTAEQKRRGRADWSQIRELREAVKGPVLGNGDIQVCEDVFRMLRETHCDGVMVGRALLARPWLMWQVGERLGLANPLGRTGRPPSTPIEEGQEYGKCVMDYHRLCEAYFGPDAGLRKFRFFIKTTSVWLLFGQTLVSISMKAKTFEEMRGPLREFFSGTVEMSAHTTLCE